MSTIRAVVHEFPDGDPQIDGTVDLMLKLANEDSRLPKIKAIVKRLRQGRDDDADFTEACFNYVVDEIEYEKDHWKGEEVEVVAAPRHTIVGSRKKGDCDCMITALACLLIAGNVPVAIKTVAWTQEHKHEFTHVFMLFYYDEMDVWVYMDPTAGREGFGWQVDSITREKYYLN